MASSRSWHWSSLGGRPANATNVELATEQAPPVIERITNGMDALIELAKAESRLEPSSPRQAVERWFDIPGGTLSSLEDGRDLLGDLARRVRVDVYNSGVEKAPSIAIRDDGIGQHPFDLPATILSLGESNKIGKHYLCGAYGHGGSSTFAWCEYSIIVSRRRPQHTGGRPDLVGWTVVRKYDDVDLKLNTYQYLATTGGEVPTFSPGFLDDQHFEFGTYIIHVAYELGRYSAIWSRVGFRFLNNLLFDPVLPFAIRDHRETDPQDRYIRGNRARLKEAPIEYSSEYVFPLGEDGDLAIRYWVFKERPEVQDGDEEEAVKIDSYLETQKSIRTIAITLNGQRHSYLEKSLIRNDCRFPLLAESLLVQVDCDLLSRQRKKDLFPATRTGVKAGERRLDLIENCLAEALTSDTELKRLESERLERRLARLDERGEREVRRLLDRLIAVTRMAEDPGTGQGGKGTAFRQFKPKDPPTLFRFVDEASPVRLEPGGLRVVDIRTDGPNDMLHRSTRRARLRLEVTGDASAFMRASTLRDGRLSITAVAKSDARVGTAGTLRAVLEMKPDVYFTTERPLIVAPPPPPYVGNEPPTLLRFAGKRVPLRKGQTTGVQIQTDCHDDILSRPRDQARLDVTSGIPGVDVTGRRGPRKGQIDIYLTTSDDVPLDSEGELNASLRLADGTTLEDTKPCIVLAPPSRPPTPNGARQQPSYKIVPVWKEEVEERDGLTWDDPNLNWNETHVGKHDLSGDTLLLYVNMDHDELVRERVRRLSTAGSLAADRLDLRYKAYVGYHLWLHFEKTRELWQLRRREDAQSDREEPPESAEDNTPLPDLDDEMRRVARTVLLAMRSEQDLIRQLAQD